VPIVIDTSVLCCRTVFVVSIVMTEKIFKLSSSILNGQLNVPMACKNYSYILPLLYVVDITNHIFLESISINIRVVGIFIILSFKVYIRILRELMDQKHMHIGYCICLCIYLY
jgi:hypothetical protein